MEIAGRVNYTKIRDGAKINVIYERDASGEETFSDQESGEVRWQLFAPAREEHEFARRLLSHGGGSGHEYRGA